MSDLYSELLVKKERTAKDRLVKGSIIALIVLLVLAGLFIMPPLLIAAIVWESVPIFLSFQELIWNLSTCL